MKITTKQLQKIIKEESRRVQEYGREDYDDGMDGDWKSSVPAMERLNDAIGMIDATMENLKDAMDEENYELLRSAMIQLNGVKDALK